MEDSKEIESILWHEFGHLLIDLLLIEKHHKISIKELLITNFKCQNVRWCGWVELEPKANLDYAEVVKDFSLTAFKFLSLVSGCVFQTINEEGCFEFEDCFSLKREAIGKRDYNCFWWLHSHLKDFYSISEKNTKKLDGDLQSIIFEKYIKKISNLKDFLNELGTVINEEAKKIYDDFIEKEKPNDYSYILEGESLKKITERLFPLINNFGFRALVEQLYQELIVVLTDTCFEK